MDEDHGAGAGGGGGSGGKDLEQMCTLFLAAICQAKEHIEHLEVVFSQDVYPALTRQREADLERDRAEAERRWQQERAALVAERDSLAGEKEALDSAVARLEQDKRDLEAKVRSLKRKRDELQEDVETRRLVFRRLVSRYKSLKKEAAASAPAPGATPDGEEILEKQVEGKNSWRSTRAEKGGGRDPHDDFLNTPQELALRRITAENAKKEKPGSGSGEREVAAVNFVPDTLGIEWDNHIAAQPQLREDDNDGKIAIAPGDGWISAGRGGIFTGRSAPQPRYKFNEPVRKKAEREALKGVECNQCKRFYDAVGHDDGNSRCEHHNDVSRHRYKYVPPSTPEGFWNIGFSEN